MTAFFVPLDRPGVSVSLFDDLGCRGLSRGSLALDGVEVADDARIGDERGGFRLVIARALIGRDATDARPA